MQRRNEKRAGTFLATTDTGHMIPKKFLKPATKNGKVL